MKACRKIAALALCAVLLVSLMPIVFAADAAPALQFDENGEFKILIVADTQDIGKPQKETIALLEAGLDSVDGDEKTGVRIIAKALEAPIRQIAANAGLDGSVILEKVRNSGKLGYGFDAYKEEYCDMVAAGIIDPAKVTRSALENAASVSAMVLPTESLVADKPEPPAPAAPADPGMGGMY